MKAQKRPSNGEKIKSILLLFTMYNLLAHRHTEDRHTKWTRITCVIYSTPKDPTDMGETSINLHHRVFLNTQTWDSHPNASPEGPGTSPSEKYQRWPNTRPLGAAMRLTALRKSPTDISKQQKNSKHLKIIPEPLKGSCPQLLCKCRSNALHREKRGSRGLRAAPYDSVRAPSKLARSHPLL